MSIFVLLLLSFSVYAYVVNDLTQKSGFPVIEQNFAVDGWHLIPSIDFLLINEQYNPDNFDLSKYYVQTGSGEPTYTALLKQNEIRYIFIYDIEGKKYIGGSFKENGNEEINNFLNSKVKNNSELEDYYSHSGVWIYKKTGDYRAALLQLNKRAEDIPTVDKIKLVKGWNFVLVVPSLKERVDAIKGNCNIEKMVLWNDPLLKKEQNWVVVEPSETLYDTFLKLGADIKPDTEFYPGQQAANINTYDIILKGKEDYSIVLFKVTDACQLGLSVAPPPIPG